MQPTNRLYDQNAYDTAFTATVLDCTPHPSEDGLYEVVLDRTLFFPEGGGQTGDRGQLAAADAVALVSDTQRRDGVILHTTDRPLSVGAQVQGEIDFVKRFDFMQQHTGEHIMSGLVCSQFGYDNVGFHLSENSCTMDYNGALTEEDIARIEREANEAVWRNLEVRVFFPEEEALEALTFRSKKEIADEALRIVEIPGIDVCACCAPHVARTGEVGLIKVTGLQNYKGGVRLNIVCGKRALAAYQAEQTMVTEIARALSTSAENLPDRFSRMRGEIASLKAALRETNTLLIPVRAEAADVYGEHAILFYGDRNDVNGIRDIVNFMTEKHSGYCAVFAGDEETGYLYILGSAKLDSRKAQKVLTERTGARGGGKERMVQGSIKGTAEGGIAVDGEYLRRVFAAFDQ